MEKGILWWDLTRPHFAETGACDLMEEHFRKSLGADYSKLFKEKPEKARIVKFLCVLRCFLLVGVFWNT